MSYCVNCGVELDKTCEVCPLCHTKVVNPNEPVDHDSPTPFATRQGTADSVQNKDVGILITVILASTALVCGLLNLFFFPGGKWSLYIIGVCVMLWIFCLPLFFPNKLRTFSSLMLDALVIAAYLGVIYWLHPGNGWYLSLALPILGIAAVLILILVYFLKYRNHSILSTAAMIIGDLGIFCVSVELLVRRYLDGSMKLTWGIVAFTCCFIIDCALITILRRSGLRNEVRRRMHI